MVQPDTRYEGGSSGEDMEDLNSMLNRIRLGGARNEPTAVDNVAEKLRATLQISDADNDVLRTIAQQFINMDLNNPDKDDSGGNQGMNGAQSPHQQPELQETWSGETFSSAESNADPNRDPASIQTCPTSGTTSPSSMGPSQSRTIDSQKMNRGRSPQRTHANASATAEFAPKPNGTPNCQYRENQNLSDRKQKSNTSRRSPSPFRNLFNRLKKDADTATVNTPSSNAPPGLKTRNSFGSGNGMTTPRPPMSPYPPSSEASSLFDTAAPPTPSISDLGLATDLEFKTTPKVDEDGAGIATKSCMDFSAAFTPNIGRTGRASVSPASAAASQHPMTDSMDTRPPLSRAPMPSNNEAGNALNQSQRAATAKSSSPDAMDAEMFSPPGQAPRRGRSRTPSRNPRAHTPSHNRSRSLPRTGTTSKERGTAAFRGFSPGRFFHRAGKTAASRETIGPEIRPAAFAANATGTAASSTAFQSASPKRTYEEQPTSETPMPHTAKRQETQDSPNSSNYKTPAPNAEDTQMNFATGKGKMRRKTSDPQNANDISTDESFASIDGDGLQHNKSVSATSPLFNVNLMQHGSRKPQNKGKRGNARKNNVYPQTTGVNAPGQNHQAAWNQQQQSQQQTSGLYTTGHQQGAPTAPHLSPMETEPVRDQTQDATIGNPVAFQFSIGTMGPTKKNGKRNPTAAARTKPNHQNAPPNNTANTNTNATAVQFSIGMGVPKKNGKRHPKPNRQGTAAMQPKTNPDLTTCHHQPQANPYVATKQQATSMPQPSSATYIPTNAAQANTEHVRVLECVESMRRKAGSFYKSYKYHSSILSYTDAIQLFSTVDINCRPNDKLALLYNNRAAALLMIGAVDACISDCQEALQCVSEPSPPNYVLTSDSGPVLKAKILKRMARGFMKQGDAKRAEHYSNGVIEIAQYWISFSSQHQNQAREGEFKSLLEKLMTDSTTLKSEASDFQKNVLDKFDSFEFPDLQPVHSCPSKRREHLEALGLVSGALSDAPCCLSLHEKRLALLANLKRWREVAGHCERMASVAVQFDGVLTEDLAAKHPYPNVPPAKELNAKFFGDPQDDYFFRVSDLKGAELKLGTKAASEAILRIPKRFVETYLRALRLEERYVHADAAISVLQKYIESKAHTSEYDVLCAEFQWLGRESSKVARTKRTRERGDELFRSGNFEMAIEQYGLCLRIDSEGILDKFDPSKSAGGRLHAVLHCNTAACLMALKKFDEAVEECDYALKVHHKYMKAVLRRARCYSRLERLEESIAEYQRYLKDADTARQSPESYFKMPCVFDGPQKVTDEEYKTAKNELDQVCKKKKQKESRPRNDEGYNQERQKFREAAHNSSRSTFNSAHRRREQWHNQEGASGSRCFDPFNNGPGTKRSPKQRYKQQSRNTESSRRPSAAPENSVDLSGTHYGVLQIPRSAAQAEIKRAYKTLVLKYHPDKNRDPGAKEIFLQIKAAYDTLNDPSARRLYDSELRFRGRRF